MKCFSMQIDRQLISDFGIMPGVSGMVYVKNHRPDTPSEGIVVPAESRELYLDDSMKVNITPQLLRIGLGNGDVTFERGRLTILRASVRLGSDGYFELIPELPSDKEGALCFFDVGSGGYNSVEYVAGKYDVLARGVTNSMPFIGYDTVALVALKPGSYVHAQRYGKRWMVFGESVLRETLSYFFDGKTLSLKNNTSRK